MATQEVKIIIQENDQVRELSGEELNQFLAQREIDATDYAKQKAANDALIASKATAKAALLQRLGITADEAALLL
jgi:topoisomerase IA-like protein